MTYQDTPESNEHNEPIRTWRKKKMKWKQDKWSKESTWQDNMRELFLNKRHENMIVKNKNKKKQMWHFILVYLILIFISFWMVQQ